MLIELLRCLYSNMVLCLAERIKDGEGNSCLLFEKR